MAVIFFWQNKFVNVNFFSLDFFWPKLNFWHNFFFHQNYFLDQFFGGQKILSGKHFSCLKAFCYLIFFGQKRLKAKICLAKNNVWSKICLLKMIFAGKKCWPKKIDIFWLTKIVCLVVRLVILAENGGKTGVETGPPLANYSTMHIRVICGGGGGI